MSRTYQHEKMCIRDSPKVVRRSITKEESDALTNIIQLVRFAFHQIERLDSVVTTSCLLYTSPKRKAMDPLEYST